MKKEIAIIGAGIGGLYAAYKLKNKHRVTVFEKKDEIGGLLGDFCLSSNKKIKLEKTYHHIFSSDKEIIGLIDELGLSDKLIWKKENNAIIYNKKVYSFCGPIDLLKFPLLSMVDKLRLGLVTLYLQKEKNYKKFKNYSAYEWMRRYCGEKVYKIIWKPLLENKFGDKYKDISMIWLWARIHFRGNTKLGYLNGGFGQIIEKLSKKIKIVKKEVEAKDLTKYDLVIDTSPLKSVEYLGAIDVVFTSKQYLSKFYWHNINEEGAPFVAFINQTNMVDDYGKNVYYLGGYYPQNHRYFKVKDEIIYKEFFEYLKQIWPDFEEKEVVEKYIFKFKNAQHIPNPLSKPLSPAVAGASPLEKGRTPMVVHMNFAQIYPQDRGVNYAIRMAREIISSLK
jgi:protoporphyrinogen oxidase